MTDASNRLRLVLSRICSPQTMSRLVDPILADIQVESDDAVGRGRIWRRRWVQFAGYVALFKVLAWQGISALLDWTPADRQVLMRTIGVAAMVTGGVTLLLVVPALANSPARAGLPYLKPFLYLIPQGLPLAIPIGVTVGLVWGTAKQAQPGRSLIVIALFALVCTAAAFFDLVWIVPGANQAYRVSMWGPDALRGPNELTLGELRALLWGLGDYESRGPLVGPNDWHTLAFSYYTRWALTCTTLLFALFTLSMPRGRLWRSLLASAMFLGYYELLYGGRQLVIDGTLPAYAAAWFPNVALLGVTVVSLAYRFRQTARSPSL